MSDASSVGQKDVVVHLRDLKKSYPLPGKRTLDVLLGVDLDIRRGDFTVVQGTSGIGKSTLLHVMGLLDRPDSGSLEFEGVDMTRASSGRRAAVRGEKIGFVFQFFHLLPEFTALENVIMPGRITHSIASWFGVRKSKAEKAEAILERVGLADRMRHRPSQLSGGERQRVALARALANEPRVLLCDEPTGNLDVRTSESIHELLAELNSETEQTMVVVTHDPDLAHYASRLIHIADGFAVEQPLDAAPEHQAEQ